MKRYDSGKVNYNNMHIRPHNIVCAWTSERDYEMNRYILLTELEGLPYDSYVLLDGGHCSCYDFDETEWEATEYTEDELKVIASADYNKDHAFWKMVLNCL